MRVCLLGPVRVLGPAGEADLPGIRQRALVAVLALHPGEYIAQSRLIDALWGADAPRTAAKTLHSHVARVRQALAACGLPGLLATRDHGYALDLASERIDAYQFEEYVVRARSQPDDEAVESLRQALGLWRGEAGENVEVAGWAQAEFARLTEARLSAIDDLWEAELRRGQHELAANELPHLLVAHPTRERRVGLLMLARYRSGWHAAALEAYQRLRERLADELGVDPGPVLQDLYAAILRRDPGLALAAPEPEAPSAPKPAQLPAPVGHFTGRSEELAGLDRALTGTGPRLAVVSGAAGMGKTALAVQWAHHVRDRFPDGQLFLDLRGHDRAAALEPAVALAYLLRGLGVAADRIPADLAERTSLYRTLLQDKRILLVLDNAGDVEDILPMVPGTTESMLLVTSRARLAGLATHHAVQPVYLDVLGSAEAVALLTRAVGADRVAREPDLVGPLAELCDRMPLALRIAAAKLAARPRQRIADLIAELESEDRLGAFAVAGDSRTVRAVFATAYHALSPAAARLFRRLSLSPGATVSGHLAAAVLGTTVAEVRPALDELVTAHLLVETMRDRYRYHDLIQLYGHECATADEPAAAVAEATDRIVDWYVAVAGAANQLVDPGRDRVAATVTYQPVEMPFGDRPNDALVFLDAERHNLVPVVRFAATTGRPAASWRLTYLLTGFFDSRGHWQERVLMCQWGLAAAREGSDPAIEGLMRSALGVACIMTRQFEEALTHLDHALALMRRTGDQRGEGHINNNIAVALSNLRRFDDAVRAFGSALEVHAGYPLGRAIALSNIGEAYLDMGEPDRATGPLTEALGIALELGNARLEAAARHGLGRGCLALGSYREAIEHLGRALDLRERAGDRRYSAHTCNDLGLAYLRMGEPEVAIAQFRRALALSREVDDQHVSAVSFYRLGLAHMASGSLGRARYDLEAALRLRRQVPDPYEEAHLHRALSDLARAVGEDAEAKRHRDLAIDLYRKANATAEAEALTAE